VYYFFKENEKEIEDSPDLKKIIKELDYYSK